MTFGPRKFQTRKISAIAALGLAGFLGVAGCTTPVAAVHPPRPPTQLLSPLAAATGNDAAAAHRWVRTVLAPGVAGTGDGS
jgi:hypothetical protein